MEIRNLKITKRGKICGALLIGIILISIFTLIIFGINEIIDEHNYVRTKYAVVTGDLWRVSPQISGKLTSINVKPGDTVTSGTVVLVLDKNQLKAQLNAAALELKAEKAQLDKALEGAPAEQVDMAITQVRQAQASYSSALAARYSIKTSLNEAYKKLEKVLLQIRSYADNSKAQYDEDFMLKKLKATYADKPDKASEYIIKANALQQLFSMKSELDFAILQLRTQQNNLDASQVATELALKDAHSRLNLIKKGPSAAEISLLDSMVRASQAQYSYTKLSLNYTDIKASHSGTVIGIYAKKGEILAPGVTAATVMDLSKLYITAYIDQEALGRVKIGQKATLKIHSDKNYSLDGKVYEIGKAITGISNLMNNGDIDENTGLFKCIPVKIAVDYKGIKIIPGMKVIGKIKVVK